MKKVILIGPLGRMGREAVRALAAAEDIELVGVVGRSYAGHQLSEFFPDLHLGELTITDDLRGLIGDFEAEVMIDLATHEGAFERADLALQHGIAPVLGVTGFSDAEITGLGKLSDENKVPGILVPNFAIGAVLMMQFSAVAAKYLPDAEIIEMHHEQKLDAPSGTAIRTANLISAAKTEKGTVPPTAKILAEGARGAVVGGVPVHSVRLPGLVAHQQVMFGGFGETLTIRHDSMSRAGFMPGVLLCVRKVQELTGFHVGLETLLA